MIDRDLQSILDEAVQQLVDLPQTPAPKSPMSQLENKTLYAGNETPDYLPDHLPDQNFLARKGNMGLGTNGTYGSKVLNKINEFQAWETVSRLFPYLERSSDPRLFDHLIPDRPPGDMPPARWLRFIEDARAFVASGWLDRARSLGWSIDDLFGADDVRPYARLDKAGLVLLLNGERVVAIGPDVAAIETQAGARHTYRRRGTQ
jgi:hypothetical protein